MQRKRQWSVNGILIYSRLFRSNDLSSAVLFNCRKITLMNGRADAAEIGTTIIIYSLCVRINPHQQRRRQAKPESRLYSARPSRLYHPLVKPRTSRSYFSVNLQSVSFSRTTHRAGGHVAWLASSETEFRGRPPSQCGVDVRSCVSCRSHCYLFVYAHKRIPRYQGLVAESVLYE